MNKEEIGKLGKMFGASVFDMLKKEANAGVMTNVVSTGLYYSTLSIFNDVLKSAVKVDPDELPGSDDGIDITEGQTDDQA